MLERFESLGRQILCHVILSPPILVLLSLCVDIVGLLASGTLPDAPYTPSSGRIFCPDSHSADHRLQGGRRQSGQWFPCGPCISLSAFAVPSFSLSSTRGWCSVYVMLP